MERQNAVHTPSEAARDSNDGSTAERWHVRSLSGDQISRDRLLAWVHACATEYFQAKTGIEPLLTHQDAQDLASECVVEFSKCWTRVRSVSHYCRRMYKNNLRRYLKRRRRLLHRESILLQHEIEHYGREAISCDPVFEFERYSDEDLRRIRFASREVTNADLPIRELFHYRVLAGSLTYAEIAESTGATETSLRMRMARFNRRVRREYARSREPVLSNDRRAPIGD